MWFVVYSLIWKKRVLIEFLVDRKSNMNQEVVNLKDEIVERAQVKANSGSMMGFVGLKIGEEDWITYFASLIQKEIYFFPSDNESYFIMMINCSGADIVESDFEEVLEIHHPYEKKPIFIKAANWKEWKDALVVVAGYGISSIQNKIKSNGRLSITIYSGQNIRLIKPAVSILKPHVFIKITLDSLEYRTSIMPQEYLVNWNQTFIL